MKQEDTLIRARLKTPRAAAIAGILFAVLLIICRGFYAVLQRRETPYVTVYNLIISGHVFACDSLQFARFVKFTC